jgi:hypothetical protein
MVRRRKNNNRVQIEKGRAPKRQRARIGLFGYRRNFLIDLKFLEEIAGRAGDIDSTRDASFPVLDAFYDAGWFRALRTIRALVRIHDLFTVAGLGNLRHNSCSPWC